MRRPTKIEPITVSITFTVSDFISVAKGDVPPGQLFREKRQELLDKLNDVHLVRQVLSTIRKAEHL